MYICMMYTIADLISVLDENVQDGRGFWRICNENLKRFDKNWANSQRYTKKLRWHSKHNAPYVPCFTINTKHQLFLIMQPWDNSLFTRISSTDRTLKTWNASNWMFLLLSRSKFIINFRFSGLPINRDITLKFARSSNNSPSICDVRGLSSFKRESWRINRNRYTQICKYDAISKVEE